MGVLPAYKGYYAKVDFDTEDMLIVGEVIGVSDSLNFHAETKDQIIPMFHQCIDNYLTFCKEVGKDPEKSYKGSFNIRVTPEFHKRADVAAAERGISLNQFVSDAIEHELDGRLMGWIYREDASPMEASVDIGRGRVIDFIVAKAKNEQEEPEKWQLTM